jgi:hypothetical protein
VSTQFTIDAAATAPASGIVSFSVSGVGEDAQGFSDTYFVSGETQVNGAYVVGPSTFNVTLSSNASLSSPLFLPIGQQRQMSLSVQSIGNFVGQIDFTLNNVPSTILVSSAPGSPPPSPSKAASCPSTLTPSPA